MKLLIFAPGKKIRSALCLLTAITIMSICLLPAFAQGETRTVKVGYFEFPGYHEVSADGMKSGYGYEYLHEIAKYTNWEYEYYDDNANTTYEQCLEMLEEGSIDVLTSVSYNEERDKVLDYSELSMGTKDTILTVSTHNTKYRAGDYEGLDGIYVGMLNGNTSNERFAELANDKGFSYTYNDSYNSVDELIEALKNDEVEAILTSNLRYMDDERIIAEFAPSPYYITVREGNTELLEQIDYAMEMIKIETPSYESELYEKYYGFKSSGSLLFTDEEKEYIKEHPTVEVILPPEVVPLSSANGDDVEGIAPDIIRAALEDTGLEPVFITPQTTEDYYNLAFRPGAVAGMLYSTTAFAEEYRMRLTAHYLETTLSMVALAGEEYSGEGVWAVSKCLQRSRLEAFESLKDKELVYYDDYKSCIDALVNGEAKTALVDTYIAEELTRSDYKSEYRSNTLSDSVITLSCGVSYDADPLLYSIINKSISALSYSRCRGIAIENTMSSSRPMTLNELMHKYPLPFIMAVIVLFLLFISVLMWMARYIRIKSESGLLKKAAQLSTLMSDKKDRLFEIDYGNKRWITYNFADGILETGTEDINAFKTLYDSLKETTLEQDCNTMTELLDQKNLRTIIAEQGRESCTVRLKNAEGVYRWTAITVCALPVDVEHTENALIFFRDVDEVYRAQEEMSDKLRESLAISEHSIRSREEFLSKMSHEIRTPMNAILGYMMIAAMNIQSKEKVSECISKTEVASRHLLAVINDILDMSAIGKGAIRIMSESISLSTVISDIEGLFVLNSVSNGIKFNVNTEIEQDAIISDSVRLKQILINLLSNAFKFTPAGGEVEFTVRQTAIKHEKVFYRFTVRDTGIGMSEEFLAKMWTPFEQERGDDAREYGGSGLGLPITKNLIDLLNGTIAVRSIKGKGTTFNIDISFSIDSERNKAVANPSVVFSGIRAIVIDDDKSTCEYVKLLLNQCTVECDVAICGAEALEKIETAQKNGKPYSLCLSDWKMPDMDGMETFKRIQEISPELPVVIVTAYDYALIEKEATKLGVRSVISKPLYKSALFDMLMSEFGSQNSQTSKIPDVIPGFEGSRLLLAEDNDMNREICMEILVYNGFWVDSARDGTEAVEMFLNSPPGEYSAILMDVQMPRLDGYAATKLIRDSEHPDAKKIPIIAVTANAFDEDIAKSLSAGMNDHVSKPIDITQLIEILKKYIV